MIYLDLLIAFLKVGCFSFGGAYGAIPLVRDVVLSYGWMSEEAITYMLAVSESTPGPIMVNMATYVGSSQGGFLGALIATTASILPSFITILLLSVLLKSFIKNKYVQAVISGLKPCVIGIVLATGIYLVYKSATITGPVTFAFEPLLILGLLLAIIFGVKLIFKKKLSSIAVVAISALLGIIVYGV